MERKVWFQLLEASGVPFLDTAASSFRIVDEDTDIEDIHNQIHACYDDMKPPGTNLLCQIASSRLKVYANMAAHRTKKPPLDEICRSGGLVEQRRMR